MFRITKWTHIIAPNHKSFEIAFNKDKIIKLAKKLGMATPKTVVIQLNDRVINIESSTYPVVIKTSAASRIHHTKTKIGLKNIINNNNYPIILSIQEYIV